MKGLLSRMLRTYGTKLSCLFPLKMSNDRVKQARTLKYQIKHSVVQLCVCVCLYFFSTDLSYIKFSRFKNISCCCLVCN